jgi:hypothetical protein
MRDINLELGGLLLDMAALAGQSQRAWGYKRAAGSGRFATRQASTAWTVRFCGPSCSGSTGT